MKCFHCHNNWSTEQFPPHSITPTLFAGCALKSSDKTTAMPGALLTSMIILRFSHPNLIAEIICSSVTVHTFLEVYLHMIGNVMSPTCWIRIPSAIVGKNWGGFGHNCFSSFSERSKSFPCGCTAQTVNKNKKADKIQYASELRIYIWMITESTATPSTFGCSLAATIDIPLVCSESTYCTVYKRFLTIFMILFSYPALPCPHLISVPKPYLDLLAERIPKQSGEKPGWMKNSTHLSDTVYWLT